MASSQLWTKPDSSVAAEEVKSPVTASAPQDTTRQRNPGRRVAQIVKLRPEYIAKYKECHANVWPEVLQQIKACNIADYSIFHDEASGLLFASFKYLGYDWDGDMQRMAENPKVREWWRMTDGYQESLVPGAKSSEAGEPSWWKPVEEVFYQP